MVSTSGSYIVKHTMIQIKGRCIHFPLDYILISGYHTIRTANIYEITAHPNIC